MTSWSARNSCTGCARRWSTSRTRPGVVWGASPMPTRLDGAQPRRRARRPRRGRERARGHRVAQCRAVPHRALRGQRRSGACSCRANFRLDAEEIRYIIEHSGSSVLLVDPELDEALRDIPVKHRFVLGTATDPQLFLRQERGAPVPGHGSKTRRSRSITPRGRRRGPRARSSPTATSG